MAYSLVSITTRPGARLGGNEAQRSCIVARRGAALLGVIVASLLSSLAGAGALVAVFFADGCRVVGLRGLNAHRRWRLSRVR